jgi:hypothetical protein
MLKGPQLYKAWHKLFREGYISAIGPLTVQSMAPNCLEKDASVLYWTPQLFKAWKPNGLEKDIFVL